MPSRVRSTRGAPSPTDTAAAMGHLLDWHSLRTARPAPSQSPRPLGPAPEGSSHTAPFRPSSHSLGVLHRMAGLPTKPRPPTSRSLRSGPTQLAGGSRRHPWGTDLALVDVD